MLKLKWNDLNRALESISGSYPKLQQLFGQFRATVKDQVTSERFHVKGIAVVEESDEHLTLTFCGRTIRLQFTATLRDTGTLQGAVNCYLVQTVPTEQPKALGSFTFTGTGETDIKDPEHGETLHLPVDMAALYIVLHFMHTALKG